ncbi:hypothetical protein BS78_10G196300 [Paspalum vaginatum]|nr:hypothetical protein BS78_10G196300 [Paspalum vaginatum]
MIRQASCHGRKLGGIWRGRRGLRVRAGGVRLALLLRLRVRLSGIVGLLLRRVEELIRSRCRPGGRSRTCRLSAPRASSGTAPPCHHHGRRHERDQNSYAEAIADCLEFIKSSMKDSTRV